jgi:hypothetical protein
MIARTGPPASTQNAAFSVGVLVRRRPAARPRTTTILTPVLRGAMSATPMHLAPTPEAGTEEIR